MTEHLLDKDQHIDQLKPSCPITRYNYFVKVYNNPSNLVDNQQLTPMGNHSLYTSLYSITTGTFAKVVFILMLVGVPFANTILLLLVWYSCWVYFMELRVYRRNRQKVPDPFKNMVYNQQICHSLGLDYKFIEVELKDLQGFVFNYNQKMREELSLRRERGKVRFMVYSSDFWKCFTAYPTYQCGYAILLITATLLVAVSELLWMLLFFG